MRLFLLAILLLSGWGMAQSNEPSLAELSRQARERKAKTQKPARLITNADLKNFQNAPVSMSKAAEQTKPADETKATEEKAPPGTSEADAYAKLLAEWKPKFQSAVLDYKNAVNKGQVLQLRLNNMYNSFYAQTDDAARARFGAEVEQTMKEIENNKQEVAAAAKAIDVLKLEARAAGVEEGDIAAMVGELPKPASITDLETLEPQTPMDPPQGGVYGP
ncbi:MAG: hypothetical protein ACE15E_20945 [Acidobacteriota bacterium]